MQEFVKGFKIVLADYEIAGGWEIGIEWDASGITLYAELNNEVVAKGTFKVKNDWIDIKLDDIKSIGEHGSKGKELISSYLRELLWAAGLRIDIIDFDNNIYKVLFR